MGFEKPVSKMAFWRQQAIGRWENRLVRKYWARNPECSPRELIAEIKRHHDYCGVRLYVAIRRVSRLAGADGGWHHGIS